MEHDLAISSIASVIQLAVAPVFLLTGIGALLATLTTRLGRAIDRGRFLDRRIPTLQPEAQEPLNLEARLVWRRITLINWAIRLNVTAALAVCLVVMLLFVGDLGSYVVAPVVSVCFVAAMVLLITSLLLLLYEVSISTSKIRQSMEHLLADTDH